MSGGTISGNTASSSSYGGGGVSVSGGTFTMLEGAISGNTTVSSSSSYGGGGVSVSGGAFTMSGGTISGNTASYGGGVRVSDGTFRKNPGIGGNSSGVIYGSEATGADVNDVALKNTASSSGSAIYCSPKKRNTTAGQTDYIATSIGQGLSTSGNAPFGE
jgi:hypothetical protein